MKSAVSFFISFTLLFALLTAGFNLACKKVSDTRISRRNIAVNRINSDITKITAETGASPADIISEHKNEWQNLYGRYMPEDIFYIPADRAEGTFLTSADKNCAVCIIYDSGENIKGIAEYVYSSEVSDWLMLVGNIFLGAVYIITAGTLIYVYLAVIRPFRKFAEYPERLARLRNIQKLPESRSRSFGKYIWGMNMLSDVLASENRKIHMLEGERQKLVSTIAHGVKTPIANIKLYTEAVRSGLYSDGGITDDIAGKIDHNAARIEKLAAELLASSDASLDGFDTEMSRFNARELADIIYSEYHDRMEIKRIPFRVECTTDAVMESDKYALYRSVSQLLENAVKYGDGSGINVSIMRQDDVFCISVRDKGGLLPEKELPYVFRSYWRGSNASNTEGSGIGLYAVHETVKKLGGKVIARRLDEKNEMEFVIYIWN